MDASQPAGNEYTYSYVVPDRTCLGLHKGGRRRASNVYPLDHVVLAKRACQMPVATRNITTSPHYTLLISPSITLRCLLLVVRGAGFEEGGMGAISGALHVVAGRTSLYILHLLCSAPPPFVRPIRTYIAATCMSTAYVI